MAESFQGLSQVFHSMSAAHQNGAAEELGQIQNELTGKICASCDACAVCWERDPAPLYGALSGILSAIWNGETPGEEKKQELAQYCRHSSDMVEEAVRVFERVSLNRAWYQRLVENREVIAEQLDAMRISCRTAPGGKNSGRGERCPLGDSIPCEGAGDCGGRTAPDRGGGRKDPD